jgi:CDP-paratose 2-epimerase
VAWFVIAALTGKRISIYGDGKQVRDILFVEDLLNAYDAAIENPSVSSGQVYNIGGGAKNVLSVWTEFQPILERLIGKPLDVSWGDWRPGDQKVYVSDIRKASRDLKWAPKVSVEEGIEKLFRWVQQGVKPS